MFQFRLAREESDLCFLNIDSGAFEPINSHINMFSAAVDSILTFKQTDNYNVVSFESSAFKRFSVAIAIFLNGGWRLRYRLVTTTTNGVLVFKLKSTMNLHNGKFIPPESLNTIAVYGIRPKHNNFKMMLRILLMLKAF